MGVTLVGYSLWAGYYGKKVGEEIIEEIATAEEKGKSTVLQYEPPYQRMICHQQLKAGFFQPPEL